MICLDCASALELRFGRRVCVEPLCARFWAVQSIREVERW